MLKIKEVEITGNGKTIPYYKNLGYDVKCKEKITVKIEHLIETSAIKIPCYCDVCGSENSPKYFNYIGNIKRNGLYRCNDCAKSVRGNKIIDIHKDIKRSKEIQDKTKNTCLERYGVEYTFKVDEIKDKCRKTMLERYGNIYYNNIEKIRKTCLEKYGVKHPFQSEIIRDKINKTMLERYGVDNPFKCDIFKEKIRKTLLERYGVDNPTKNTEIFEKAQRHSYCIVKHNDIDVTYQGTYELDFINFLILKSIPFEKGPTIDYILDGINRKYHSDFYIPSINLICEVKSNWTYRRDIIENETKKEFSLKSGYNFLFIMDKDYSELIEKFL